MNRREGNQTITYDVYVGNVPKNINEEDFKQLFSQLGEVKQAFCRWKEDFFGYGIVKFYHKEDADKILRTVQDVTWNGYIMPVKTARRSDHNNQNGNSNIENKLYSDMNKNQIGSGSNFSNTDFGHFQYPLPPPSVNEKVIRPQEFQPMNLHVNCTSVEDSVTFYGHPIDRAEDLVMIKSSLSSLNKLNYSRNPLEKKPILKKVYAAVFSEDDSWYRCTVIKTSLPNKPGMCAVRYIDYGNEEEVSYQNIIEIPESLQRMPPIACKFVLSGVVSDTKATNKQSCPFQLVNQRITLYARKLNHMEYEVFRCTCNGKDVISDINKNFPRLGRHDSSNHELNPKSRANACGGENRVPSNYSSHASSFYTPKTHESPVVNGTTNSSKKTLKSQCKSKEGSPKNEDLCCNGTAREIKKEDDFHPKRIAKRGSELGDIVRKTSLDTSPKEKSSNQPAAYTLDSVHPNLKFINNIRCLVSQSSDDSIISYAVNLLKNEISTLVNSEASIKSVISATQLYWESVRNLKIFITKKRLEIYTDMGSSFSFEERLSSLKTDRDSLRVELVNKLQDYIESCDTIFQRKEKILKVITDLASNSNAWMNVQLPKKPETIDELILEYNKIKEERWSLVSKTRAKTDQAHQQFNNMLSAIQKEFHLNSLEENEVPDLSSNVYNVGKTPSFDDQLKKDLTVFGIALEEEIQTLTVNKDSGKYSVIQCLLDILDIHKEKIELLCKHYENHYAAYNELNKLPDIEKTLKDIKSASEEVLSLREKLYLRESSAGDDSQQEVSALRQLHCALLKEDSLKGILAKASEYHFPELFVEAPELNLLNSLENKLLLKNWRPDYFLNFGPGQRGEFSYASYLCDEPITIKEYSFENAEECNAFIQKTVQWNEVRSDHIVKVKALFYKDEKTICAMLPPVSSTLMRSILPTSPCDGEKACRILQQILIGLKDIHSIHLVHHAVHPTTVIIENEKALIDFCFDPNFLDGKVNLKGINFLPPDIKATDESADMYGFGCLILWVLFPNLSFTPTEEGIPDVAAFRSIIQELILPKDYAFLSSLIDANPERRPSSCTLLKEGFLSKYEAYCRSRYNTQKSASM